MTAALITCIIAVVSAALGIWLGGRLFNKAFEQGFQLGTKFAEQRWEIRELEKLRTPDPEPHCLDCMGTEETCCHPSHKKEAKK